MTWDIFTLPNILTLSRFVFTFFIAVFLLSQGFGSLVLAAILFCLASLTDFYDGYLAKKYSQVTDFGKIMDPIADKVMILTIFVVLAYMGMVEWWMVVLIAIREISVTGSRLLAMRRGQVLPAEKAGKIKTVCQMLTIALIMLFLICEQTSLTANWFYKTEPAWRSVNQSFLLASVFLTVASGVAYFRGKSKCGLTCSPK
jgi:CDP-diacylglycerol---glycerol-3-phosphate 3-phosphatidyltransferase